MAIIDKVRLQKRFSKQATVYDQYAHVQKQMATTLVERLLEHTPLQTKQQLRILEIGCGTGELTHELLTLFPEAEITAIDIAPGMIDVARGKCVTHSNITFVCADIEQWVPSITYDLIISNATFQWFNHLETTSKTLYDGLSEDGLLLFSTFGERTFTELHESHARAGTKDYVPARLGPEFHTQEALKQKVLEKIKNKKHVDFTCTEMDIAEYFPNPRLFLRSIQQIGATNSLSERRPIRPSFFKRLFSAYDQHFRFEQGIRATYHTMYVALEKR